MSNSNSGSPGQANVDSLRELCAAHATHTEVNSLPAGSPDWRVRHRRLENVVSDYFNIGLYEVSPDHSVYLLEQKEGAVILLLLANSGDQLLALLQLRSEPGLIGLTNLTATIQSTPNNFRREHGGRPTPFIDIVENPNNFGEVIYDGFQFDWGDYYLRKTKRFLVVRLPALLEAPAGFVWTDLPTLAQVMRENHLVSTDLRSCFNHVFGSGRASSLATPPVVEDVARPPLVETDFSSRQADSRHVTVGYFGCRTLTREVSEWIQPLLIPSKGFDACLHYLFKGGRKLFAVTQSSQLGLLGLPIWFPADLAGGTVTDDVLNCAEGGRFWRSPVRLRLIDMSREARVPIWATVEWIDEEEMSQLISGPLQTSLELRLTWSLVLSRRVCPT